MIKEADFLRPISHGKSAFCFFTMDSQLILTEIILIIS